MDKRSFLKGLTLAGLSVPLSAKSIESLMSYASNKKPSELAMDEAFWEGIKGKYRLKPDYINLESGYYNILPQEVLEKYINHIREVNFQGAYYMRTVQFDNIKLMANKVAKIAGCSTDELILTRNTTESLDMIIGGLNWQAGDEAIMAEQDYLSLIHISEPTRPY